MTAGAILTRRAALWRVAGSVAGVVALPLAGCGGLVRPPREDAPAGDGGGLHLDATLRDALYHASLAPSGHNMQPWAVRVLGADRLRLEVDGRRRLPAVDPTNRELLLAMGAFLENFVVAAGARGLVADYDVLAMRPDDVALLDVRLRTTAPTAYPLGRIKGQRTVKLGYLARAIRGSDVAALLRAAGDGAAFFPSGSPEARYLDEGTIDANRAQAARDAAQEELVHWVRLSDADGRRHRDGLTPESLEMGALAGFYARHFMKPQDLLTPTNRARNADSARDQVRGGGGWLVVTSADARVPTLVDTGRRFERLLLGVRERMIAVHPMTQLLEEAPFASAIAGQLDIQRPIQFLLRVGYLDRYPDPVSLRRPVSWFIAGAGTPGAA